MMFGKATMPGRRAIGALRRRREDPAKVAKDETNREVGITKEMLEMERVASGAFR
jgi:hypothetical protein